MNDTKIVYVKQKDLAKYREDNKPADCPILGHVGFMPVVDHDHKSGKIRGVVSSEGNALLGKIENFYYSRCVHGKWELPKVLRALANYLEMAQGPYHPVGLRQVVKRFNKLNKDIQIEMLLEVGVDISDIDACKNSSARSALYRKYISK
jgi:hypothetical protein